MAPTLTATPGTGNVLVTFIDMPADTTFTRDGRPVRYPPVTGSGLFFDFEARAGETHTYTGGGASVTVTVPPGVTSGVTLVHPTDPTLTQTVKVRDDNPNRWEAPGTVHEVMGAREPVVTHTLRTYHTGTLEFWTPWNQRQAIIDLFADGSPILVNPPVSCPLEYEWTWGSLEADKIDVTGRSGIWWIYDYQRVATPSGHVTRPPDLPNTYAGVLAEPTDNPYSALPSNHATYVDILTTMHPHGGTP